MRFIAFANCLCVCVDDIKGGLSMKGTSFERVERRFKEGFREISAFRSLENVRTFDGLIRNRII